MTVICMKGKYNTCKHRMKKLHIRSKLLKVCQNDRISTKLTFPTHRSLPDGLLSWKSHPLLILVPKIMRISHIQVNSLPPKSKRNVSLLYINHYHLILFPTLWYIYSLNMSCAISDSTSKAPFWHSFWKLPLGVCGQFSGSASNLQKSL